MNDIRIALEQALELISASRQRVYIETISSGSPARLSGLSLIALYLSNSEAAIKGAIAIAKRL